MATSTTICGPCSERYTTKPTAYWCSDCQEAICDDCQEHHKVLKVTRSHELIPIDKYKSLPSFITDIQQSCTNLQYCVAHALPICFKCIKEHQKCNVIPLGEVTSNAKTSGHFQDLETRLIDLLQNIDRIKKDRQANLKSIEERKELHLAEVHIIYIYRNQINKHLDKLEKEIKQELEKKECHCKGNIQKILSSVKEKENLITEYQTNLQSIKQHASDIQTFLGIQEIETKVFKDEQFLQSLKQNKQIDHVDLVITVDPGLISFTNSVKNFGLIDINTKSSNICLIRAKNKQAQLQVTTTKTINDLKLILQKTILTGCEQIRGCCMSVNGEYFFMDHYTKKTLSVIAADGSFNYKMLLSPACGFDITLIDAITSGGTNEHIGIDIINIESLKKTKFISLPDRPWGITRDQDSLFVCVEEQGIYKVNTMDYTTSHVISCNLAWFSYVSVYNDKIYYTNWRDNNVVCCDSKGSRLWRFKDESVLMSPRGITVDKGGKVCVVGEKSSNVVITSNDGKHHRQILTKKDGLREPSAIFFDKQTSKLLVANEDKNAFLYSVT